MTGILCGFVAILLALLALTLQRLFSSVPARELKRLARRDDPLAKALYRPVSYGAAMRLFLWLVVGLGLSLGLLLLVPALPVLASLLLLAAFAVVAFIWVPTMRLTVHTAQFAAFLSPAVTFVLSYLNTPLSKLAGFINQYRGLAAHSRLYEKEDLLALLDLQKQQVDNRIVQDELELADRSLRFGDRQAADVVRPRKSLHLVNADDTVGPILLDQLHKSGQNSFLVYKDKKENIIGSLSLKDAVNARKDIRVLDLIRNDLTFVHEDFSLRQVLTAFQYTGQHVAVVINGFEEFLGTISLDDILKELFGENMEPVVDSYENRSGVAAFKPKQEEPEAESVIEAAEPEPQPEKESEQTVAEDETSSPEATEVVK
jgi:CBS domain containing-hemolysin-like protein